ncbi:hypothetical protein B0I72DRAFT_90095 [Yarrowia lipolytica]|uniref:Manganese-transporting ATPase 1 n=2 Tax=Yarrowia lipolytica TaxID=4952 RepID=A0A371CDE5_YARLL|nr:hypothetical protein BKA91DRAFT_101879 [Yarrowia lipolytica]KAE8170604.1 hypothetical protein BKA90DRAFT_101702 [Yarrowia lipolytica]RDW28311.1 hypothetical protein B0I71DRAFT_92573 [Yarrowia lipolytica]RDW35895.1 hypothetical protein B0I72DRAFT_90095 [Yarrowia lipolytica]RDW42320.1 hypothetical protein B0I73DRAFT_112880 [Yarrowia lipolytica]
MTLVSSPSIASASLHRELSSLVKLYIWPFVILYPIFTYAYVLKYDTWITGQEWTFLFLGSIMTTHALTWLGTHWNVNFKSAVESRLVSDIKDADLIKLFPAPNCGAAAMVPIVRKVYESDSTTEISFVFQKRRYIWNPETKSFAPPHFTIDDDNVTVGEFQTPKPVRSDDLELAYRVYGPNKFDIPVPTFSELFYQHAVAPFFVFQIFCVALWCLDEKWYYSIFTLIMLVMFESTVVWQRQRTMTEFRGMGLAPYPVQVYRDNAWSEIQSDQLLPGDIVSVTRSGEDSGLACDMVLIAGTCIVNEAMLSGESTPLLKESIQLRESAATLDMEGEDKNSILSGGTKALQVTPPETNVHSDIPPPPDAGCVAVVTKTGFETAQGTLVRVMIFATEHVGVGNAEALFFILFLLQFAIAASYYVWTEGVRIDRNRSKLLLDCVLIVTSVVPPELPMELSMAVNSSLAALSKFYIYCTEPFRIPFAGRLDICCFDKTGTLTEEDLLVEGITGLGSENDFMSIRTAASGAAIPDQTVHVLAAAHALVLLDEGDVVGDPMEKNTLASIQWTVGAHDVISAPSKKEQVTVRRRFQFSSALKRSSSIASHSSGRMYVATKGAPETIKKMLVSVPKGYDETYKHYTRAGKRVLALASKDVKLSKDELIHIDREHVESDLVFAGFLVFSCPIKPDAKETIKMLNESSHRCVMITGDNPLTGVHVAKEVGILYPGRKTYILDLFNGKLAFRTVDEVEVDYADPAKPLDSKYLDGTHDVCVTGSAISSLTFSHPSIGDIIRHAWVYARVSPSQKETLVSHMKDLGYMTLMCGDGTNDVGALKQAHVGVALLNGTVDGMKKMADNARITTLQNVYNKQCEMMRKWGQKDPPIPMAIAHLYPPGPLNVHYVKAMEARGVELDEKTKAQVAILSAQPVVAGQPQSTAAATQASALADKLVGMSSEDMDEAPTLKLGDASVAAPFTSKLANVSAVTHIVRQGRCALVTTIQMYKILALNCLISAYTLSILFFAGCKTSDSQATVCGLLLSVCFISISRGKPIEKLSRERPQPGIFNIYIMGSILGQFAVHIVALIYIRTEVYKIEPRENLTDLDRKFEPSILNTAMYLLQLASQLSTIAVNYQGRPFRESIRENRPLYFGLLGVGAFAFACSTEFMPEINEQLQLVHMPDVFKVQLTTTMALDLGVCWLIELVLKHFFSDYKPSDVAQRHATEIDDDVREPLPLEEKKNQ